MESLAGGGLSGRQERVECAAADQSVALQAHRAGLESDGAGMRFSSLHQKPSVWEGRGGEAGVEPASA